MKAEIDILDSQLSEFEVDVTNEIFACTTEASDGITEQHPLYAYSSSADPDTMYYHEAMNAPDKEEFQQAMLKEVQTHFENETFELKHKSVVTTTLKRYT